MRKIVQLAAAALLSVASSQPAAAQVYPPGTFSIDGIPVTCWNVVFIVNPNLPDVGMARPGEIHLNPNYFYPLPTSLRLWWAAHECGHHVVGANESAADCWAIQTGRNQGWFPPNAFYAMMQMFENNPGDIVHPPGPVRVQQMIQCYGG